ncbi:MAG: TetR/AcrR family transcriptional regulator, partial [Acidimicrobiales bacterium]
MARDQGTLAATDGRVPGRRGRATRQRLLQCTAELLATTPWRSIKVIDIARQAGTSPATFYQYFENVEQAILVLAEELMEGAGDLAALVDGDWSEEAGWATALGVVEGFMD